MARSSVVTNVAQASVDHDTHATVKGDSVDHGLPTLAGQARRSEGLTRLLGVLPHLTDEPALVSGRDLADATTLGEPDLHRGSC